jgi:hypothetical protein
MKNIFVLTLAVVLTLALAVGPLLLSAPPAKANPILTVNLTSDATDRDLSDDRCDVSAHPGSQCTLRAALREANNTPGADAIYFNIPGGGVKTIRPNNDLPFITQPVTINGYTQHGSKPNSSGVGTNAVLHIQLDGSKVADQMPEHGDGLHVHAPHTVIRGLAIGRFHEGIQVHRPGHPGDGAHGAMADDVRITGCFIGTSASGTQARPNQTGIEVHASRVFIGGDRIDSRNLISGNTEDGIRLVDPMQTDARVLGNWIGTDHTGTAPLGNGGSGIHTGQSEVHIGGDEIANIANTIRFNGGDGVSVVSGKGTRILTNSISDNDGIGIDLNDDGPTPNDADDADSGANSTQNVPVITVATAASVEGTLPSTPNSTFSIRIFSNQGGDEGQFFRGGPIAVTTDAAGNGTFTFTSNTPIPTEETLTATATSGDGTSEFSAAVTVS